MYYLLVNFETVQDRDSAVEALVELEEECVTENAFGVTLHKGIAEVSRYADSVLEAE